MTKTLTLLAVGCLTFVACGGVDRAGTRDQFIEDAEQAGFVVDGQCVDDVLDDYSDDEIERFANGEDLDSDRMQALGNGLLDCTAIPDG